MSLNESDTCAKLINPAIHACGWTEDPVRRLQSVAPVPFQHKALSETLSALCAVRRATVVGC